MSPFEKIEPGGNPSFPEPMLTIAKRQIFFNKACIEPANLERMKAAEIFWDEADRVLKIKVTHLQASGLFALTNNKAGSFIVSCAKLIQRILPERSRYRAGRVHVPVRWDEKEKAFIGAVPAWPK